MMLRRMLLTLLLTGATAVPAAAKDVCVATTAFGPVTYVFRGVKIPKAGRVAPIHGIAAVTFPRVRPGLVQGTIYGQSDGLLRVDLLVQGLLPQGFAVDHVFTSASVDRKFFTGPDTVVLPNETVQSGSWTPIDCKTLTVP